MKAHAWFLGVAMLALVACSTSPVKLNDAKPVSPDRMYVSATPGISDGTVIVIRDSGLLGHGCGVNIFVDDQKSATIGAGKEASIPVHAGDHILSAAPTGKGLCGLGDAEHAQRRDLKITVEPQHSITFRVGLSASGDPVFSQTSL